ncbi:MAG: metal ABC transporter permease [Bdellovibrionales bacterium]|nr:metal ABC transporter permease [Bdellovibrionales bacterium]
MIEIVGPALGVSLIIALTHAPLGIEVLRRGIIFIDLAIAQIAGLGVVAASFYFEEPAWWMVQGAALLFALLAAFFFRLIERRLPQHQEAIIGCSFVLAASVALLLLSDKPHGGEEIEHLLSGQILFVTWREVLIHGPIYGAILFLWFGWPKVIRESTWFYVLFSVAITSSVQLVGVYVVFASLILPALAAASARRQHLMAWGCGITAVVSGVLAAVILDAPAGPVIVLAYALVTIGLVSFKVLGTRRVRRPSSLDGECP